MKDTLENREIIARIIEAPAWAEMDKCMNIVGYTFSTETAIDYSMSLHRAGLLLQSGVLK